MGVATDGYVFAFKKNLDYAQRLVADLSEEQMIAQPAPESGAPSNHPAWILSHLNVYLPIISSIIDDKPFDDPKEHKFGMQSKPESDASIYEPKSALLEQFVAYHEKIIKQLEGCDDSVLNNKIDLERWAPIMPTASIAMAYLMLNHENLHLGQLSAWRRIQGMPSV